MFQQGVRRCASAASARAASMMMARPRAVLSVTRQNAFLTARSSTPLRSFSYTSRRYDVEAAEKVQDEATISPDEPAKSEDITAFRDLLGLGVNEVLVDAIATDMGYKNMTPVQAKTINPALKGTDIVAQAKTGTGKTIAFLLPLLQRMILDDPSLASRSAYRNARSDDIRGIVLSPTRELAEQIAAEARRITKNTGLVVQCAVGGTSKSGMLRQTQRQGCHLLVATPGRLNDLLSDASSGIEAPNLSALVLDEADRMLDVGFEKELNDIVDLLPRPEEKTRQTMLVSATIPDNVIRLARTMVRPDDFEFVQTIPENESLTHDKVPQHVIPLSSWTHVFPTLLELFERETARSEQDPETIPFKAIVYFNTTAMVELAGEMGHAMRKNRILRTSTFCIHSKLSQMQRTRAADNFRRVSDGILFSSDVTARGMDFPNVSHVIQIDTPADRESYIHRLGRTGRQDKQGEGMLLLPPQSVSAARSMLRGLPLKQDRSLKSAEAELDAESLPEYHQQVKDVCNTLPKASLSDAYRSVFGRSTDKADLAQDMKLWFTKGLGWENTPTVDERWVHKMGIPSRLMNLGAGGRFDRDDNFESRGRFGGASRFGGRGGGRGGDRFGGRGGGDAFDDMGRMARRDSAPRRGGRY